MNILHFISREYLQSPLVSHGTRSCLFRYTYLADTGVSLWWYWLHLEKKIQTCLSPHFCWLWKPCCFLMPALAGKTRAENRDILGSGQIMCYQSMGLAEKCGWKWCDVPLSTPDNVSPPLLCSSDMTVSRKMFWIPYDFCIFF